MTSALALEDERYGGFPAHLKKVYDVEGKTYGWGSGDICDGIGNCHTYPFFARIGHRPSNLYFLNNPAVVGRRTDLAFRDGAVSWTLWQSLAYSLNRKGS